MVSGLIPKSVIGNIVAATHTATPGRMLAGPKIIWYTQTKAILNKKRSVFLQISFAVECFLSSFLVSDIVHSP